MYFDFFEFPNYQIKEEIVNEFYSLFQLNNLFYRQNYKYFMFLIFYVFLIFKGKIH
jgi:hypothetical protein